MYLAPPFATFLRGRQLRVHLLFVISFFALVLTDLLYMNISRVATWSLHFFIFIFLFFLFFLFLIFLFLVDLVFKMKFQNEISKCEVDYKTFCSFDKFFIQLKRQGLVVKMNKVAKVEASENKRGNNFFYFFAQLCLLLLFCFIFFFFFF
jgi:hypothetical protein